MNIITHSGNFHLDELFAITFVKLFFNNEAIITRTREEVILEEYRNDSEAWVLDVGGEYNPDMLNFDHHQNSFKEQWSDGTPLSTCGLVWNFLKEHNYLSPHMTDEVVREIEEQIILKVDKQDNGIEKWHDADFIGLYNRTSTYDDIHNRQFEKALTATIEFFENKFLDICDEVESVAIAQDAIEQSDHLENVIVLDTLNHKAFHKLNRMTDKMLVAMPRKDDEWKIQSLSYPDDQYSRQCPMPEHWRGLTGKDLSYASGFDDMIFCHKSGFMCIFKGDENKAILVADIIKSHYD